jgi:hypothetical protein
MERAKFWFGIAGAAFIGFVIVGQITTPAAPPTINAPPRWSKDELDKMEFVHRTITKQGYVCEDVMNVVFLGRGFIVDCTAPPPGNQYRFILEDHGGRWSVTAQ